MIISRAPYRVSFVGGGTDLKSFYQKSYGENISTSINKYIYIIIKRPKGVIDKKYKINMGKVQHTNFVEKIKNPIVRETLKYLKFSLIHFIVCFIPFSKFVKVILSLFCNNI